MMEHTGRKIAIIADVHGLLQPLEAAIVACKEEEITEIYSLGDNIGDGPNPLEVIELLEKEDIKSVRGNAEEYAIHGITPFDYISNKTRKRANAEWTINKVKSKVDVLKKYPVSIDLVVGGKNVALCHFIGDVRSYISGTSTWNFQDQQKQGNKGFSIFRHVNTSMDRDRVINRYKRCLEEYGEDDPRTKIAKSEIDEPLFGGKPPSEYDAIIQGHVHFKSHEQIDGKDLYTARGLAFGFTQMMDENPDVSYNDKVEHGHEACFMVLEERTGNRGFDVSERFVSFDREAMRQAIINSENYDNSPSAKFTEISEKDVMEMASSSEAMGLRNTIRAFLDKCLNPQKYYGRGNR